MYAQLDLAREAVCEQHRQAEASRQYRQGLAARRSQRKAAKAARAELRLRVARLAVQ